MKTTLAIAGLVAVCAVAGPAAAASPCPSRNAAAQLLAGPIARHGLAMVGFNLDPGDAAGVRDLKEGGVLRAGAAGRYVLTPKGRALATSVSPGRYTVAVGTYLLAGVNAITAAGDGRCAVDFTVTLFPSDLGRRFQADEAHIPVWARNAVLFDKHETTTTVARRGNAWRVDERNLLPWMHLWAGAL